ncbi:MAG: hypothetical protein AAF840_05910 [Bacteroidota bacterium]
MSKTRIIPGFAGTLIARALEIYAPRIVAIIPSPAVQALLMSLLMATRDLVKAISDSNPENRLQVETIIRAFFRVDAIPLATGIVWERINTIGNERVRKGLSLLAAPVLGGVEILTDEDPDNATQAETILDDFILNPETQEFVVTELTVPVLERVIKDPLILSFVLEALEQGVAQGAIELAEIEVFNRQRTVAALTAAKERAIASAA